MTVASPCIGLCKIDSEQGFCQGCRRTLVEIAQWGDLAEDEQRRILALLPDRAETHPGEIAFNLK